MNHIFSFFLFLIYISFLYIYFFSGEVPTDDPEEQLSLDKAELSLRLVCPPILIPLKIPSFLSPNNNSSNNGYNSPISGHHSPALQQHSSALSTGTGAMVSSSSSAPLGSGNGNIPGSGNGNIAGSGNGSPLIVTPFGKKLKNSAKVANEVVRFAKETESLQRRQLEKLNELFENKTTPKQAVGTGSLPLIITLSLSLSVSLSTNSHFQISISNIGRTPSWRDSKAVRSSREDSAGSSEQASLSLSLSCRGERGRERERGGGRGGERRGWEGEESGLGVCAAEKEQSQVLIYSSIDR
jgi:hypothetical protein